MGMVLRSKDVFIEIRNRTPDLQAVGLAAQGLCFDTTID